MYDNTISVARLTYFSNDNNLEFIGETKEELEELSKINLISIRKFYNTFKSDYLKDKDYLEEDFIKLGIKYDMAFKIRLSSEYFERIYVDDVNLIIVFIDKIDNSVNIYDTTNNCFIETDKCNLNIECCKKLESYENADAFILYILDIKIKRKY